MRFCSSEVCALILAVLLAGIESPAIEVKPVIHASLNAALEAAAAEKAPVLLILSASGKRSGQEITEMLTTENIKKLGPLKIASLDTESNGGLGEKFSVTLLPAFILLGADGKVISRHEGFSGMDELLDWLKEGRMRLGRGEWEGISTSPTLESLATKAQKGELTDEDLAKLVADLANPNPEERAQIAGLIQDQRERSVPSLLGRLSDPYLGARVAASDLLRKMLPGAPEVDPWLGPKESAQSVAALQKWWSQTGKLPEKPVAAAPDPAVVNSIQAAIEKLKSDEPLTRTEAMSALVRFGHDALPSVRDAIKRFEKKGDQRSIGFLEEVRWSILIPAAAERMGGGLRQALARGASPERQDAATRLARCEAAGFPALAELVNDPDPLVVENAVRSLSTIGGVESVPAMAVLLKAGNSNLRMTAAQALGKTKRKEALPHLISAVEDSNEVVATAALAAIEEIFSKGDRYSSKAVELPPEALAAIKGSLADPRWRVRATAAEIAGKLQAHDLEEDIRKLMTDRDPFVVKTSLICLQQLGAAPEAADLVDVIKRIPSLRAEVIQLMVEKSSPAVVKAVSDIYLASKVDEQITILQSLQGGGRHGPRDIDATAKPLLASAVTSPNPSLRAAAASLVSDVSPAGGSELITPLLADSDLAVQKNASRALLEIFGAAEGASRGGNEFGGEKKKFAISAEKKAEWKVALEKSTNTQTDLFSAVGLFLVSDGKGSLPSLESALGRINDESARKLAESGALLALLPQLSWPEAKDVFQKMREHPLLLASAASASAKVKTEAADFLLDPALFWAVLDKATDEQSTDAMVMMAPFLGTARAKTLLPRALESKNPKWKATALSALAQAGAETNLVLFVEALTNKDETIRLIAIQGIAASTADREKRDQLLAPALSDENAKVRRMAALALLESEILDAAQLQYYLKMSPLAGARHSYNFSGGDEERPLPPPLPKTDFAAKLAERVSNLNMDELPVVSLLLAQYGIFDGLEILVTTYGKTGLPKDGSENQNEILVAIALSKDAKYIPFLRTMAAETKDETELRRFLRAVKGMTGREAREFRVELNKLMRKAT